MVGATLLAMSGSASAQTIPPPLAYTVALIYSAPGGAYEQTAQALQRALSQTLRAQGRVVQFRMADGAAAVNGAQLYVALGVQACERLARLPAQALSSVPVFCTLLPRQSFDYLMQETGRQPGPDFSALYLNQSLERQFDLLHLAFPSARRVGVLLGEGPIQRRTGEALTTQARARGLRLVSAYVSASEPLFAELKTVLDESDVLLALADPQVYNGNTIQNILLASFRAQVPMQAFSPAYAQAGALLALYATPEQIGSEAAGLLAAVLASPGKALPAPQHPRSFQISVNAHVARALGFNLDEAVLTKRLRELEMQQGAQP
jgi:hypothetical protein